MQTTTRLAVAVLISVLLTACSAAGTRYHGKMSDGVGSAESRDSTSLGGRVDKPHTIGERAE